MLVVKEILDELGLVTDLPPTVDAILSVLKTLQTNEYSRPIHLNLAEHVGASVFEDKVDCVERLDDAPPLVGR